MMVVFNEKIASGVSFVKEQIAPGQWLCNGGTTTSYTGYCYDFVSGDTVATKSEGIVALSETVDLSRQTASSTEALQSVLSEFDYIAGISEGYRGPGSKYYNEKSYHSAGGVSSAFDIATLSSVSVNKVKNIGAFEKALVRVGAVEVLGQSMFYQKTRGYITPISHPILYKIFYKSHRAPGRIHTHAAFKR